MAMFCAASTTVFSAATVEEKTVGPAAPDAKYVVSPRGVHLATVARKGSRVAVVLDGVDGPRFDEILTPQLPWVDPRGPAEEARLVGTIAINLYPLGPVTFSKDGNRFAYLARLSKEWVLMADNKEVLRIPVDNIADMRLQFTGNDGKHLLFAHAIYGGYELWVDGQKWPGLFGSGGGGSEGTIDPLVSPDGTQIAYLATMDQRGEKRALIVNGKEAGYIGDNLKFTADSKHLLCLARSPKGQSLLVDGKPLVANAKEILAFYVPPVGHRIITVMTHFGRDGNSREGQFLLIDNKPVEATLSEQIKSVTISPDGKRYAAVCGRPGAWFVVVDGKKGQEYFDIYETVSALTHGISFSPDSSKVAYAAIASSKTFVVVNDEESDAFEHGANYQFSPDSKRVAMTGLMNQARVVIIDGKVQRFRPNDILDPLIFSPDSSRYALPFGNYVDGKATGLAGDVAFSPDSKHFAVAGMRVSDNYHGLFVDGQLVSQNERGVTYRAFSPDSKHLFWMTLEDAVGAKAGPGIYENVVYADGKPVARCDYIANAAGELRSLYGISQTATWKTPSAWSVSESGALSFLGPVDDVVKRFTVTPSSETSIATAIADVQAAAKATKPGK